MTRIIFNTGMLFLVLTGLANISYGQFNAGSGARSIGMARSSLLLQDEYGLFNNPGSTSAEQLALILSYNTRFLSMGINDVQAGLVLPLGGFNTGFGVSYYGDDLYNQLEVIAMGSHKVGFASLGARIGYHQYYLENYGYKRTVTADLGGVFVLSPQVKLGMLVTNLTRSMLRNQDDYRLSSLIAMGFSYQPITAFRLDLQLTKDLNLPVSGSLGIEYQLNTHVFARTGFNFSNSVAAFGLGFQWSQFRLDVAGNYHPRLGYSTAISILLSRKNVD